MGSKLDRLAMNENGFIFDPQTGVSYTTNTSGYEILNALKDTRDVQELKEKIVAEFEVSEEEAERDIIDFMEILKSRGIIE